MASSVESLQDELSKWLLTYGKGFSIERDTTENNKLIINGTFGHFYIISPENKEDNWTVWSNDSSMAQLLSTHVHTFTSTLTVTELMNKIISIISSKTNSSSDDSSEGEESTEEDEEGEDGMYDYYELEDNDADEQPVQEKDKNDDGVSADDFFIGDGSPAAVHRLLADLKNMSTSNGKFGITGSPRGDNLFIWDVQLSDFDPKSLLYKDLENYAKRHQRKPVIEIEMKFPRDYPMNPPFVRVIRPRFQFLTGHVTIGGSICMQMLTRSGWSPSNDIESILVQVRAEIMSDPKARLDSSSSGDYSESEARQAFERMVHRYGWNK